MNPNAPAIHIDGIIIPVTPHPEHEYTLTTAEVASGYGVSEKTIQNHKLNHSDELIHGKHFVVSQNMGHGNLRGNTAWTKRGIIRLGFFIKSERAKRFRDMAEDLCLREWDRPALVADAMSVLIQSQVELTNGLRDLVTNFSRFVEHVDTRFDGIEQRLAALEAARPHGPAILVPDEDHRRLQTYDDRSEQEIASDMLRLVAHLAEISSRRHSDPADVSFTAREIITRAAKLQCFRRILRGRFLADGTFEATPSARSSVGKLLSQRFGQCGFILDDGKPVFLRHSHRGRSRRYYVTPDN